MTLNEVVCTHPEGSCPWACEGYIDYCVAEKQNPIAYYATKAVNKITKQKEDYLVTAFENVGINPNIIIEQDALINKLQSQLNAVRELHKPKGNFADTYIDGKPNNPYCPECVDPDVYPCPTIRVIEAESL